MVLYSRSYLAAHRRIFTISFAESGNLGVSDRIKRHVSVGFRSNFEVAGMNVRGIAWRAKERSMPPLGYGMVGKT